MTFDILQLLSLLIYTLCLAFGVYRRMYRGYWLGLFVFIAHSVLFYAVVNLQNAGVLIGWHTMGWGLALRLHLGIVILGYLVHKQFYE